MNLLADELTPLPVQRIGEILEMLRKYMSAVIRANMPRDLSGTVLNHEQRERLRQHRDACRHPNSDLVILKTRLTALNGAFVLAGEIAWRLDELEWETNIWRPLSGWVERGYRMLFDTRQGLTWPHPLPECDLDRWQRDEQEIEWLLTARTGIFCPDAHFPVINEDRFSVRWRGDEIEIGNNAQFRLLDCLVTHIGRAVSYADIGEYLCGDDLMSAEAIRQTVCRLRKRLPPDLAECIVTECQQVRLDISLAGQTRCS